MAGGVSREVVLAVIGIMAAPLGGWLTSVVMRRKYDAEVRRADAETKRVLAETVSVELGNARSSNDLMMVQVELLFKELIYLKREIRRFRDALDSIAWCKHRGDCPVSRELQREQGGERGCAGESTGAGAE